MSTPDRSDTYLRSPDLSLKTRGRLIKVALLSALVGVILVAYSEVQTRDTKPQINGEVKAHTSETKLNTIATSKVEARGGAGYESTIDYLLKTGQLAGTGIDSIGQFALAVREIRFYDNSDPPKLVKSNFYTSSAPFNLYQAGGINDEWWVEFLFEPPTFQPKDY